MAEASHVLQIPKSGQNQYFEDFKCLRYKIKLSVGSTLSGLFIVERIAEVYAPLEVVKGASVPASAMVEKTLLLHQNHNFRKPRSMILREASFISLFCC